MLKKLENDNKIEKDGGALISSQQTDPRILITKSDGSYLYITTDLATAVLRNKEITHEKVLYVTDNRQKLHFEQLFQSLEFFEFPSKEYEHIGFGTINDSNGNPLKTRDGGNLKLIDLYEQAFNQTLIHICRCRRTYAFRCRKKRDKKKMKEEKRWLRLDIQKIKNNFKLEIKDKIIYNLSRFIHRVKKLSIIFCVF